MQESTTREKVLKKIRNALINRTSSPFSMVDFESPVYFFADESPEIMFARNLQTAGGHFIFCEDKLDFATQLVSLGQEQKWKQIVCPDPDLGTFLETCEYPFVKATIDFKDTDAVITPCECLLVITGSILISSGQSQGRRLPAIAQNHVVVAYTDQLVEDIRTALQLIKHKYKGRIPSMLSFITGPSRTADIEMTQVRGAHGPREVFVFLIDSERYS